jgi:hypothetical protein
MPLAERKYPIRAGRNPESARKIWNLSNDAEAALMGACVRLA